MAPWFHDFGWAKGQVSAVGALALCAMAIAVSISGYAADRWGARPVLMIGSIALAIALSATALMRSYWQFAVGYGLFGGVGFGFVSLPVVGSLVVRRIEGWQGLATGIATSGTTAGQLLILPIMTALFGTIGWRGSYEVFAALTIVVALFSFFMIGKEKRARPTAKLAPNTPVIQRVGRLLRSRPFHGLFWSFALCGFTSTGVVETHLIPFAQACGFPPMTSTLAYSVFAAFNLVGMLSAGYLSDRVDRRGLLITIYLVRSLAFVIPLFVGLNYTLLLTFSVVVGLAFYSTFPATIGLSAAHFGRDQLGLVMGILTVGHALGAAAGAYASGYIFDLFLRYDYAWVVSIGLAALSAVMVVMTPDPRMAGRISQDGLTALS
ncbi:Arabinose efflux permease [Paraburkholderia caribensis MBA4]|uniref:Arabinose efflux permease n=2 Tax=Paraburkholderia caribensis TaxID=75105 RepID=A0A0P0RIJ1_9BURK|nr:Arabinose efflux permease [Paraburkholderia caribensis MBA4]